MKIYTSNSLISSKLTLCDIVALFLIQVLAGMPTIGAGATATYPALTSNGSTSLRRKLHTHFQQSELPDYTSPPLPEAIDATPERFQDDAYIDILRTKAANGTCADDDTGCQILFPAPPATVASGTVRIGVIFYGGALVDPRSYSILANDLSKLYGLAVSVPIFSKDVAFLGCNPPDDRISLAARAFPYVERWVLVGHSLGGVAAQIDIWNAMQDSTMDELGIGGLVLLGSELSPFTGCGAMDFSSTTMPMAVISAADVDLATFAHLTSANDTLSFDIHGGNHGYFGYYDYSLRESILGQVDENATIPRRVQKDFSVGGIVHVASRMGRALPNVKQTECTPPPDDSNSSSPRISAVHWLSFGIVLLTLALL